MKQERGEEGVDDRGVGHGGGIALTFQIKLFKFKSKSSYRGRSHLFSSFCPFSPSIFPWAWLLSRWSPPFSTFLLLSFFPHYSFLSSHSHRLSSSLLPVRGLENIPVKSLFFKVCSIKSITDYHNTMYSHVCIKKRAFLIFRHSHIRSYTFTHWAEDEFWGLSCLVYVVYPDENNTAWTKATEWVHRDQPVGVFREYSYYSSVNKETIVLNHFSECFKEPFFFYQKTNLYIYIF